ncbi:MULTISPECIES: cytochrome C oxidase subunit IV family protein [Paenibacillus]|uniref:Subunit IV of cytochrome C oxidase n=1 Tax=Paenibacillus naphthalenovorans TaxID=162209 RepID=A0A0U2N0A2_9BACL|nr:MULTISPECIES: cytochrome C oxidase subunit IV family protein [Paenibacillus]ALS24255.1 subunit IV of cytochrome C oxidase [Paenibacillus naphthalenovorans]GCL73854.1 cytochrome C oxidase subunit IV [Paenibacillus naphthalenovorans]SDI51369.1 cytochrome c oxidase subunit 4 [Paenibacillus naphthalenovorans]
MSNQHQTSAGERHRLEGPKNHYLSYIVSILLTMLAFAVVLYGGLDRTFIIIFIVGLGIVQILFQLAYWMHMKDRGHMFPIIGLAFGTFIALTVVAAAVFWMWW